MRVLAWLMGACLSLPLCAQFVHTRGQELVDGRGRVIELKGTNLGNWLVPEGYMWHLGNPQSPHEIEAMVRQLLGPEQSEAFWKTWRETYVTEADIQFQSKAGCNSVRIPLHYKFFLEDCSEGFRLLDRVVNWCRHAGLYVILDLHCAPGGQTGTNIDDSHGYPWLFESAAEQARTIQVWRNLARHYREDTAILGYDLLNEPIPHFPQLAKYNAQLEPLLRRITEAVRQEDPNHVVILTGAQWDSNFKVLGRPFDANAMYTFHKYWTASSVEVIQEYLDFRKTYNVPLWLGESGENSDEWVAAFRKTLEAEHVGWTFWPYKKMDAASSFVTFARPVNWDKIVAYSKLPGGTGQAEKLLAARPPQPEIQAAFADLLRLIALPSCKPNPGYLKALGLEVPKN